jgi:DNA-binding transcriptional LysR family regulator
MDRIDLDIDVLRTLLTAQDLGGFNRAAAQLGRSQSAISLRMRKLEDQIGQKLFRKDGRGLVVTGAGELVLRYARELVALNDRAVTALRGAAVEGAVRFGMPSDFSETWLPETLGRFKRAYGAVQIEASVDRNFKLLERLDRGELDLALSFGASDRPDAQVIATMPMVWIGPRGELPWREDEPIPLALFEAPCVCRQPGLAALDAIKRKWRVTFTSPSLPGLWAAVAAGLGITIRMPPSVPPNLRILGRAEGLPPLPMVDLSLHDAGRKLSPAAQHLKATLLATLPPSLASPPRSPRSAAARPARSRRTGSR